MAEFSQKRVLKEKDQVDRTDSLGAKGMRHVRSRKAAERARYRGPGCHPEVPDVDSAGSRAEVEDKAL